MVADATEDDRCEQTTGELRNDLGPEVGTDRIHVVVRLSQEHRTLVWEDQDDILDSTETDAHGDEEKGSVSVLDACCVVLDVVEQDDTEQGGKDGDEELDVGCLGKPGDVHEVSLGQELELVAPRGLLCEICTLERHSLWVFEAWIVSQLALLVRVTEVLDSLLVGLDDVSLRSLKLVFVVSVRLLDTFDTHDAHEVVCWIAQLWAPVVDASEVINCQPCFVKVDDLTTGKKHQTIEHLKDI
jgi:hypothetical protein